MLAKIQRKFGTAGLVVAIVALLAAMSGGAYAAAHASKAKPLTQAQIIKLIKKYAKSGPAGPAGPAGANGANGTNGTDGNNGGPGTPGNDGSDGQSVTAADIDAGGDCGPQTGVAYTLNANTTNVCNGANGANGINTGFSYTFSNDTSGADPGSGKVALNNAASGSTTSLVVSETDANSTDLTSVINGWGSSGPGAVGTLTIRQVANPDVFAKYSIAANAAAGGPPTTYNTLTVKYVGGSGSFADSDPVTLDYSAAASATLPSGAIEGGTWTAGPFNAAALGDVVPGAISFGVPTTLGSSAYYMKPGENQDNKANKCSRDPVTGVVTVLSSIANTLCVFALNATNWDQGRLGSSFAISTALSSSAFGLLMNGQAQAAGPSYAYGVWILKG